MVKNQTVDTSTRHASLSSPAGSLLVTGLVQEGQFESPSTTVITGLSFPKHRHSVVLSPDSQHDMTAFEDVQRQLDQYFAGERQGFDLELSLVGTNFQRSVWDRLRAIPFGTTVTYQSIADDLGKPKAVRAVGAAIGRNPIGIIVPCHRVIASSGALTGFAGGLELKRQLLEIESAQERLFA